MPPWFLERTTSRHCRIEMKVDKANRQVCTENSCFNGFLIVENSVKIFDTLYRKSMLLGNERYRKTTSGCGIKRARSRNISGTFKDRTIFGAWHCQKGRYEAYHYICRP